MSWRHFYKLDQIDMVCFCPEEILFEMKAAIE